MATSEDAESSDAASKVITPCSGLTVEVLESDTLAKISLAKYGFSADQTANAKLVEGQRSYNMALTFPSRRSYPFGTTDLPEGWDLSEFKHLTNSLIRVNYNVRH